ncbi:MAG: hybrid sensor histidine kinase/response regulator [Desulfobacterales bacterium]|jgi:signal transduction histidine kinase|nr:hybrid sensor histidine kinase/response regulator [Desulfobacterales bacterium]
MTTPPNEKWQLLLVDDEEDIRDVLTIVLSDCGYTVLSAKNGREALALYKKKMPPMVLTDIKMPGMDGIELLKSVKHENPDAEVIMITGHGDMDLAIESLKHEAADFVTKPVNTEALKIALKRVQDKILIKRTLTQYTESLEALVREKIELQDRLSSLGLMIGSISHGVKGLLTNMDAGLYMLDSGLTKARPEQSKEGLNIVKSTAAHIKKLMLDILFYVKDRELKSTIVDIPLFIEDVADGIVPKIKGKNISLIREFEGAPDTFPLDPDFLRTALINIFDNAVDACVSDTSKPFHQIIFRVKEQHATLIMEIQDTGIGMTSETREKIFDLFFSSKGSKGTGFGLFITSNIITQHGGTITVISSKGRGATFRIRIPKAGTTAIQKVLSTPDRVPSA